MILLQRKRSLDKNYKRQWSDLISNKYRSQRKLEYIIALLVFGSRVKSEAIRLALMRQ